MCRWGRRGAGVRARAAQVLGTERCLARARDARGERLGRPGEPGPPESVIVKRFKSEPARGLDEWAALERFRAVAEGGASMLAPIVATLEGLHRRLAADWSAERERGLVWPAFGADRL